MVHCDLRYPFAIVRCLFVAVLILSIYESCCNVGEMVEVEWPARCKTRVFSFSWCCVEVYLVLVIYEPFSQWSLAGIG
jgi:hypothetical protein